MLKRRRGPDEFADDHPRGATAIRRKRRRSRTATGAAADQAGCLTGLDGGAGGIRTLDTVLPYTHFPGERLRPLGHRSAYRWMGDHVGKAARLGNLAAGLGKPLCGAPMRRFGSPPSADEIEAIARGALQALPRPFADSIGDIVMQVEEFADDATLDSLGIEDAFELSGLYEGVPLTERSVDQSGILPERVRLF